MTNEHERLISDAARAEELVGLDELEAYADQLREERIYLHDRIGITTFSGIDRDGNTWIEFVVDYFAEQVDGECAICGETLSQGWMCLNGGDEVCSSHIKWEKINGNAE
mgnify:CR=1 FL=1